MGSDIVLIVGTRPEAIKLAPVTEALSSRGLPPKILLTGQHAGLDPSDFGIGGPVSTVRCPGGGDPRHHSAAVAEQVGPLIASASLIVVQGDTSSALGGALAGFQRDIPVAHVEAGLRSFDPSMPWPEEDNRVQIDARADLLFAPTETSAANLRREDVPGSIHVTGNTGIDALLRSLGTLPVLQHRSMGEPPRLLVTCHRRENWGTPLAHVAAALRQIARTERVTIDFVLHPNPRTASAMMLLLDGEPGIRLRPPLDHQAMILAMREADILLSDSGGVQEEAPALGVPLLVLREKTERPEGIASGNMTLVGTDPRLIADEVRRLLHDPKHRAAMARPALPYGDGRAAERIAALISDWMAAREQLRRTA